MADENVAAPSGAGKPTFIYGLVDPRTDQLRYVGKTVLDPRKRLGVHLWRAKTAPHKRHSMAWILSLYSAGLCAEVIALETVPPGGDWVEAERFWIAYFRMIGVDLCNHTVGGEGVTGYKQSPEEIAKRIRRGADNPCTGKPKPRHVHEAMAAGRQKFLADPQRREVAYRKQVAGMTPEALANSIAALRALEADPERLSKREANRLAAMRTPTSRERVGKWSDTQWAERRAEIIAAQNAGKGEQWRKAQGAAKRQQWADPESNHWRAAVAKRKLSDQDVLDIRRRLSCGERNCDLAREYAVDQSTISHIKSGRDRPP